MKFERITINHKQMGGVPCIRGLVVGLVADSMSIPEILKAYPDLTGEDVQESLYYAAQTVLEFKLPPVG